jgi:DNA invertase Pin-like site-specific DNA recombinase
VGLEWQKGRKTVLLAYCRVSTRDQNTAPQEEALRQAGAGRLFIEKASGAKEDRPELKRMLDLARMGDTIMVWRLDRLARSIRQLIEIAADLQKRGIHLRSLCDNIDTSTASGELHFHMLAALAQFERRLIQERVTAGLATARATGKLGGRRAADHPKNVIKLEKALTLVRGGMSVTDAAKLSDLARSTVYKYAKVRKLIAERKIDNGSLRTGKRTKLRPSSAEDRTAA